MPEIVDVELAIDVSLETLLEQQALDIVRYRPDKPVAIRDDRVVSLPPHLQRIIAPHFLRHQRHHLADAGLDQTDLLVEREILRQCAAQRLARHAGEAVQVLAEEQ